MSETIDNCQLEIDKSRGVLYVHSSEGVTLVRVYQIPQRLLAEPQEGIIDVVFDRELAKPIRQKMVAVVGSGEAAMRLSLGLFYGFLGVQWGRK